MTLTWIAGAVAAPAAPAGALSAGRARREGRAVIDDGHEVEIRIGGAHRRNIPVGELDQLRPVASYRVEDRQDGRRAPASAFASPTHPSSSSGAGAAPQTAAKREPEARASA